MITGRQIREGRELAGFTVFRLARETKLDVTTICRAEAADDESTFTVSQAAKIEGALTRAGIKFIQEDGGRPGTRRREAP